MDFQSKLLLTRSEFLLQKPPGPNMEDKKEGLTEQCTAKGKKGE